MEKRKRYKKLWLRAEGLLFAITIFLFAIDTIIGNGDGIIDQLGINALSLFLLGQVFLLLIAGIAQSNKWLANTSLFLLSSLMILCLVEGSLRLLPPSLTGMTEFVKVIGPIHPFSSRDAVYFKNLVPGSQYLCQTVAADGSRKILNTVNSQGIRGPEVPPKTAGEHRVILLGDSFLQSDEVTFEQSIGAQLQSRLPDSFRVIQHGFPSWAPLLELNWLLRKGMDFQPDEVFLFLFFNDFVSGIAADTAYIPYARFDQEGYPTGFQFTNAPLVQAVHKRNSLSQVWLSLRGLRLIRLGTRVWEGLSEQNCDLAPDYMDQLMTMSAQQFQQEHEAYPCKKNLHRNYLWDMIGLSRDRTIWDASTQAHVNLAFRYIHLMQRYLSERKIPLHVVYIPSGWLFEGENLAGRSRLRIENYTFPEGGITEALDSFCETEGIPFIPLYPFFKAYKEGHSEMLYYSADGHWNERGHEQAAAALYPLILSE